MTELEFLLFLPEIFLLTLTCLVLLCASLKAETCRYFGYYSSLFALVGTAVLLALIAAHTEVFSKESYQVFQQMFVFDKLGFCLKTALLLVVFVVFLYIKLYLKEKGLFKGEFFALMLFCVLGMMVLCSSRHFLTLYLGLELFALPVYALVAINTKQRFSSEAAMKYFVLGGLTSGLMLYGISWLYGLTGSLSFGELSGVLNSVATQYPYAFIGILGCLLMGIAFKFGAVPFHFWVPDVYQGSPNSVLAFLSTAPKFAGLALFIRIFGELLADYSAYWQLWFVALTFLCLVFGNVFALTQTNLKRLLGYASIAHVGFILLGFTVDPSFGVYHIFFYVVVYVLGTLGVLGVLLLLSHQGLEAESIQDLRGLGKTHPLLAFGMLFFLLSFSGIPPFLGFYAKFIILQSAITKGFVGLAVLAILTSLLSLYYYLRVVKVMYFEEPSAESQTLLKLSGTFAAKSVLTLNAASLLLVGLIPWPLIWLSQQII